MPTAIKNKIFLILNTTSSSSIWHIGINSFIKLVIILNVVAVCAESVAEIYSANKTFFYRFDNFSFFIFLVEYILRVWVCTINPKYSHPVSGRLRYMLSTEAIIDLIAIIPFFLPLFMSMEFRFLRLLRLIRLFRIFKLGRYFIALKTIKQVIAAKKEELLLSFFVIIFLVIVSSGFMYVIEHHAQPEKFSSIPSTMWWSISALTTIGYGDVVPITPLGKIFSAFISILGIGLFALPAGLLASGFSDVYRKKRNENYCPHCGKEIHQ